MARNAVIDFVRTSHEHADLAQSVERAGTDAGPDELAVTRQEIDAVGAALSSLTDDQHDAIVLRFFAGLSARVIERPAFKKAHTDQLAHFARADCS